MRVAVYGLGRLGAPLAILAASKGHQVIGVDSSARPKAMWRQASLWVEETGLEHLCQIPWLKPGSIEVTTTADAGASRDTEISLVVVPTPSMADGWFFSGHVEEAVTQIGALLAQRSTWSRHTVIVVSTVMPGTMRGPVLQALETAAGRAVGTALGLVYAPQLIALGSVLHDLQHPDLVILGASRSVDWDVAAGFFESLHAGKPATLTRLTLEEAEVTKLAINAYVTMKMSFANVLGEIAGARGLRADFVAAAVGADSRIGMKYLKPATAYGGPCFPRDSKAFSAYARQVGASFELADATDKVNERQHDRAVQWALTALPEGVGGAVGVLGLAYKPDTNVAEASAGLAVVKQLNLRRVSVAYHDPAAAMLGLAPAVHMEKAQDLVDVCSVVLIMTPWREYATLEFGDKPVYDPWRIR